MKKVAYFEEAPGVKSLTRVVFFVLICYAILQTSLGLFILKWDVGGAVAFFGTIAGVATGGKLLQKGMEGKTNGDENANV